MDKKVEKTPFYEKHIEMSAKMVEFAGFYMPLYYKGVIKEVQAVRENIGLFDVSHMGEIKITGKDSERFLSYLTINDIKKIKPFQAQYTAMCYDEGGIVDDLLVYRFPDYFLLVVNATNTQKDYTWIKKHKWRNVIVEDISREVAQLAVQGPKAEKHLNRFFDIDLSEIGYYDFAIGHLSGIEMLVSRTGYTGEDGFELYFDPKYATRVWDKLIKGISDLQPCGLGARDILRLEARFCLYGNDIDKTTNPIEAGLSWITKLEKDEFIGKPTLETAKGNLKRRLAGFVIEDGIPRKGLRIYNKDKKVGTVTSGGYSPTLKKGIGLGYIDIPYHKAGGIVYAKIGDKLKSARIVRGAFYTKE